MSFSARIDSLWCMCVCAVYDQVKINIATAGCPRMNHALCVNLVFIVKLVYMRNITVFMSEFID